MLAQSKRTVWSLKHLSNNCRISCNQAPVTMPPSRETKWQPTKWQLLVILPSWSSVLVQAQTSHVILVRPWSLQRCCPWSVLAPGENFTLTSEPTVANEPLTANPGAVSWHDCLYFPLVHYFNNILKLCDSARLLYVQLMALLY